MKECECCGIKINEEDVTTECPKCGKMRCVNYDMGTGTVCCDCESADD